MDRFKIYENYRDDKHLRELFFQFTPKVFSGLDFKEWYLKGYWFDNYIPFSIILNGQIVSNVSISKMKIIIDGKSLNGIQFATVGTLPEYRNKGLSRILMEYVLDKFNDSTGFFFLFANDSVLNFYPKFGFTQYKEVVFKSESNLPKPNYSARCLNIQNESDFLLVQNLANNRAALTKLFGAADYNFITMWHIIYVYPENLFFLEGDDVLFILKELRNELHIYDIIYQKPFDLNTAISKVIKSEGIKSITYYFPPDQLNFYFDDLVPYTESPLFIRGDFVMKNKQFKFPLTAQT